MNPPRCGPARQAVCAAAGKAGARRPGLFYALPWPYLPKKDGCASRLLGVYNDEASRTNMIGGYLRSRQNEVLTLLERSGPALHALLTRLTLRTDVAEELMQELFIKLNSARNGESIENLDAYARRTAVNLAFDWRRKRRASTMALDRISEPVCTDNSPLSNIVEAEELEEMLEAISRLKETPRRVLVMRYIQQESYDHIAEQLGRSPHHVRALCSRALLRLRDVLKPAPAQSSDKEASNVEIR
jgi:RNA polymerase sigma-70 factor (ECF subfamily)